MNLDELKKGESGIIYKINDANLAIQLLSMGILIGEEVKVEIIAPFYDPILISSGTNRISLRLEDAKKIELFIQ